MTENTKPGLVALKEAMQLEIDGERFYTEAARKTNHPHGKLLFERLAEEEKIHLKKVQEIYASLEKGQKWPAAPHLTRMDSTVQNIFKEVGVKLNKMVKGSASDLEAIKVAIDMEEKSINLYDGQSKKAEDPFEKRFFLMLSYEERGHYLALLDSYDYLTDPQGWLESKERRLLEGDSGI